jgi:RNA polymerase sigma factor (sigma-70 family)
VHQAGGTAAGAEQRSAADADALVITVLQRHADTLLRVARRHSLCDEDAADAYQRGLEIFLGHARRLEADTAHRWLFRVVRNEAVTLRDQRQRFMGPAPVDPDEVEARTIPSPEEQAIARARLAQATEALAALKDDELQALWLQASGHSYTEIAEDAGWTRTKVNRALVEGRRRLFAQRAAIDSGRACVRWEPVLEALAAGRADARQLADVRLHLRHCAGCQRIVRAMHRSGTRAAALLPLGLLAGDAGNLPALVLRGGPGDGAGPAPAAAAGWATRLHELLAGPVQERAALQLVKVQAAADALSAGKVAAVAASATAIAGGGVVAVHERPASPAGGARAAGIGAGGGHGAAGSGGGAGGRRAVARQAAGGWPVVAARGVVTAGGSGGARSGGAGGARSAGGAAGRQGGSAPRREPGAGREWSEVATATTALASGRRTWRTSGSGTEGRTRSAPASALAEARTATRPRPTPAASPELAARRPAASVAAAGEFGSSAGGRSGGEFTP